MKKKKQDNTYRGIEGTVVIWHGEWADPEVRYNGENLDIYELNDYLWEIFQDMMENEKEWFKQKGIKEEETEESFQQWMNEQGDEWVKSQIEEILTNRRAYCLEEYSEELELAKEYLADEDDTNFYFEGWEGERYKCWCQEADRQVEGRRNSGMGLYEKETVWLMAQEQWEKEKTEKGYEWEIRDENGTVTDSFQEQGYHYPTFDLAYEKGLTALRWTESEKKLTMTVNHITEDGTGGWCDGRYAVKENGQTEERTTEEKKK